jgi:molecular chaperone DnaJ
MADYYKILGIEKSASPDQIKRAFRELAQKYHPDKSSGNAEKFKEINEAYQVLSDNEKKKMYDQYGSSFEQARSQGGSGGFDNFRDFAAYAEAMKNGGMGGQGASSFDFGDLGNLGDIFGDLFGFGASAPRRTRKKSGRDMQIEVAIDFREAVFGTEKEINLERNATCSKCHGTGNEPGAKIITCSRCRGNGQVVQQQSTILGTFQSVAICPECGGEGKVAEQKCHQCHGRGYERKTEKIRIKIPAGVNEGGVIKLKGYGEAGGRGGQSGDLYVYLHIRPDAHFERDGINLHSQEQISISQAVLGGKINVQTIDGEVVLKIPAGTHSGQEFKLNDKGVPILNGRGRGDQIVTAYIKVPKHLNRQQKELFEKLQKEDL